MSRHHTFVELARDLIATASLLIVVYGAAALVKVVLT
jgi:hypothetical protein